MRRLFGGRPANPQARFVRRRPNPNGPSRAGQAGLRRPRSHDGCQRLCDGGRGERVLVTNDDAAFGDCYAPVVLGLDRLAEGDFVAPAEDRRRGGDLRSRPRPW